ncbi:MAG: isopentenyl phosphate kinase [Candidatus Thorarchaeota archaeon]
MNRLTIVKLGGSVITYKDSSPPKVNKENLLRIAKELKTSTEPLIVILGGGAHGHQAAHRHGFGNPSTSSERLLKGIPSIRHNMSILSLAVEEALDEAGVQGTVFPPFLMASLNNKEIVSLQTSHMQKAIQSGFTVITHGDVCFDESLGASILSGDTIAVFLARELGASSLYIGTDVDGVLEENPKDNPEAVHIEIINNMNIDSVLSKAGPSSSTDVTGGMAKKLGDIFTLDDLDINIAIFNLRVPGRLSTLLAGKTPKCTLIRFSSD